MSNRTCPLHHFLLRRMNFALLVRPLSWLSVMKWTAHLAVSPISTLNLLRTRFWNARKRKSSTPNWTTNRSIATPRYASESWNVRRSGKNSWSNSNVYVPSTIPISSPSKFPCSTRLSNGSKRLSVCFIFNWNNSLPFFFLYMSKCFQ